MEAQTMPFKFPPKKPQEKKLDKNGCPLLVNPYEIEDKLKTRDIFYKKMLKYHQKILTNKKHSVEDRKALLDQIRILKSFPLNYLDIKRIRYFLKRHFKLFQKTQDLFAEYLKLVKHFMEIKPTMYIDKNRNQHRFNVLRTINLKADIRRDKKEGLAK